MLPSMSFTSSSPVYDLIAPSCSVILCIVLLTTISHTAPLPVCTSSSCTSYWPKRFLIGCGATVLNPLCNYYHCKRYARRVGGAKVLLLGVLLWSVGTLAAPPLAHISLFALCASRVFVSIYTALQCLVFGRPSLLLTHGMLKCEACSLAHAWSGSTPLQLQYLLPSLHLGVSFF